MFVASNRIRADSEESLERVVEAFKGRARLVEERPGFKGLLVLVDRKGLEVLVLSIWESRDHFKAWVDSEEFKAAHERAKARRLRGVESQGKGYEVVEVSGPIAGILKG